MTAPGRRVAVTGAGAIGLLTAFALARSGFAVTVFEAHHELEPTPRADTLQPASLMLFDRLGIASDVLAIGRRAARFQFRDSSGGDVVADFDLGAIADVTAYPFRLHCAQEQLTRVLFEHAKAAGVRVEFDARVTGVEAIENGVRLQLAGKEPPEGSDFEYAIAADGASSSVRELARIPFAEDSRPTRMIQIMTTYDFSKAWADLAPDAYFMDPASPCIVTQLPGSSRVLLALPDGITDRDLHRDAWHRRTLARIFALDHPISVFHETLYAVRTGAATGFRAGRILLVGDAAHVALPFSATGLNCGIHDAYFLAEALAEEPALGSAVLDAWAVARRKFALSRALADGNALFHELRVPQEQREARNARLRAIAAGPQTLRAYLLRSAMLDDGEATERA